MINEIVVNNIINLLLLNYLNFKRFTVASEKYYKNKNICLNEQNNYYNN
jgi:hypothetical protein